MIQRTFDAEQINLFINDTNIRPFVGGDGKSFIDVSQAIASNDNVFLVNEYGGFCFSWSAPLCYEIHTFILPAGRGAVAYRMAKEVCDWMDAFGAVHLWTRVLPSMVSVRRFTIAAGFTVAGRQTLRLPDGDVTYDLFERRLPCPLH